MPIIIVAIISICCFSAQLCAQSDSLTHLLDDIQDDGADINNWLEILSEQFIEPDPTLKVSYPKMSLTHRFQYTLEKNNALSNKKFTGSPHESYTRFRTSLYRNLSAGILIQKDIGEINIYDHFSGFVAWNHPIYPIKIILGNFYIRGAEGLLLSGPFSLPKIALIKKPPSKRYLQMRPFLSSNEYDGCWGGAIEIGNVGSFKTITFFSQILRDGILSWDKTDIIGFDRSGYHRTFLERTRANRINEKSYGGILSFPLFFIDQLGITFVKTQYSPGLTILPSPKERRRNFYKFYGSIIENYSLFYEKNFHSLRLSGEISHFKSKKVSYITTLSFNQSDWHVVLKSWSIPPQFQSPYGRIPADSNPFPQSIQGFMIGTSGNPIRDLEITTFWFHKKDLWRSYFQQIPVAKKEFYLQSMYRATVKTSIIARYYVSSTNFYSTETIGKIEKKKQSIRIQVKQKFNTKIRFQTRFDKVLLNYSSFSPSQRGINFYQDIYWQIYKPIILRMRFSSFDSDDYDSRLYEYENDLPHVFSNYPLYGRGRKWYIMLTIKPTSKIKLWFKYRRIVFDGVDVIGSGATTISGDMRQDVHLQIEFKY